MNITFETAQAALRLQPFSMLLDARLIEFGPELVELRVPVTGHVKQQHGFVHGGVVSYLADNTMTFAGGAVLGPAVVTSEYKINYLRPAIGEILVARASVVHAGRTQAVCRCEIICIDAGAESVCAVAQGTIVLPGASRSAD
jgi:uncharacterized protein (TIGR00369 family)